MGNYFESQVSDSDLTIKFVEHLIANIDRYYNARFLLYGFYFAMIGAILTIYFSKEIDKRPKNLFIFASMIGQLVVFLQVIISYQIEGNYSTLNLIFNKVDFISTLSEKGNELRSLWYYFFVKSPFAVILIIMTITNIFLFFYGRGIVVKIRGWFYWMIFLISTAIVIAIYIDLCCFSKDYSLTVSHYLKSQSIENSSNGLPRPLRTIP